MTHHQRFYYQFNSILYCTQESFSTMTIIIQQYTLYAKYRSRWRSGTLPSLFAIHPVRLNNTYDSSKKWFHTEKSHGRICRCWIFISVSITIVKQWACTVTTVKLKQHWTLLNTDNLQNMFCTASLLIFHNLIINPFSVNWMWIIEVLYFYVIMIEVLLLLILKAD